MKVKLLSPDAILPTKAHDTDAGFDVYIPFDFKLAPIMHPEKGYVNVIDIGIAVEVPDGKFCLLKERSSLAARGMVITAGVIDYGYRGEIKICCFNISNNVFSFKKGDKIAQLLVLPFYGNRAEEVEDVSKTPRGDKGFGSSDTPKSIDELTSVADSIYWICNHCGYENLAGRLECFKCRRR